MSDENNSVIAAPAPVSDSPVESQVDSVDSSDASELEALQNDPSLSKAEQKEVKKMIKELELKVNGKVVKESLPFEVPEEHAEYMRRQLQMAKAGQLKAQDYAALERDVVAAFNDLKNDPKKFLSNPAYGVDLKKIVVEMIEEEIANSQKTPEELEREEYKRKLKEFEEKEELRNKEIEEMKRQKVIEDAYQQYDISMTQTLDKFDIPKSEIAIYEMAHLMSLEIKRGFEPDMDIIGEAVAEKLNGQYSKHLQSLSHEKLVKLLGNEVFERDRKERVSKIKKAPVPVKSSLQDVQKSDSKPAEVKPKLTYKERWGI